jgi:hypothetical protein
MKERPILFSAPMVRAILSGSKTQTRRAIKPQPESEHSGEPYWFVGGCRAWRIRGCTEPNRSGSYNEIACPYGQPGDRLWVREAWMDLRGVEGAIGKAMYRATFGNAPEGGKWRPSIHMPRWASRITLEVTGVRVERLQDISDSDAWDEGIDFEAYTAAGGCKDAPRVAFGNLWESINSPGSWIANPWVWVVEFKKLETING